MNKNVDVEQVQLVQAGVEQRTAPGSEHPGGFRLRCGRTAHSDAKGPGCAPVGPPAAAASQDDTCAGEASAHPSAGTAAGSALWKPKPASLSQHVQQRVATAPASSQGSGQESSEQSAICRSCDEGTAAASGLPSALCSE